MMRRNMLSGAQLYMRSRQQCNDSFPKEKDAFLFQPPTRSGRGIEELKSLEVKRF
jgi:hypothetical protein